MTVARGEGGRFLCFNHTRPVVAALFDRNRALLGIPPVGAKPPPRARTPPPPPPPDTGLRDVGRVARVATVRLSERELHVVVTPRHAPAEAHAPAKRT